MPRLAETGRSPARVLQRGTVSIANAFALRAIARSPHPLGQALSGALGGALRGAADEDEKAWILKVEAARRSLEDSDEVIRTAESEWSGKPSDQGVLEETVGQCCRESSKSARYAQALFRLVRTLQPRNIVELGTCLGVSTSYQAAAQRLNGGGRLATFEASHARTDVARRTVAGLGLEAVDFHPGRFQDTLAPAMASMSAPVDYAFIDGHHEEDPTIAYFDEIAGHATDRTLVVFDDIHWSPGMEKAWQRIVADPRIAFSVDVGEMGICLMGDDTGDRLVTLRLWHAPELGAD